MTQRKSILYGEPPPPQQRAQEDNNNNNDEKKKTKLQPRYGQLAVNKLNYTCSYLPSIGILADQKHLWVQKWLATSWYTLPTVIVNFVWYPILDSE